MLQEYFFHRGATRLFYRRWSLPGERQTLVMCHGLASNGTRWSEFAEAMVTERDWNILCPDLRGHGESVFRGKISAEIWADDLAAMLDEEGVEKAVIGGHCLGANLALRFAQRHPGRTAGLVLVEPMLPRALEGALGRMRRLRYLLPAVALLIRMGNALGLYRRHLPTLDLAELDRDSRQAIAASGDASAMTKRYAKPDKDMFYMPSAAYLQSLNQVLRPLRGLGEITAPTLVLLSKGGLFGDPVRTRALLKSMPRMTLEELDAIHWIPTEQPVAMREHIEAWLDQC